MKRTSDFQCCSRSRETLKRVTSSFSVPAENGIRWRTKNTDGDSNGFNVANNDDITDANAANNEYPPITTALSNSAGQGPSLDTGAACLRRDTEHAVHYGVPRSTPSFHCFPSHMHARTFPASDVQTNALRNSCSSSRGCCCWQTAEETLRDYMVIILVPSHRHASWKTRTFCFVRINWKKKREPLKSAWLCPKVHKWSSQYTLCATLFEGDFDMYAEGSSEASVMARASARLRESAFAFVHLMADMECPAVFRATCGARLSSHDTLSSLLQILDR